jgi:hypothetical protein
MTNCDMFAALSDGSVVTVNDYYSKDHNTPSTDADLGGSEDISLVSYSVASSNFTAVLKRKLSTGDSYDQDIVPDIHSDIVWAYRGHNNNNNGHGGGHGGWEKHSGYCKLYIASANFVWATSADKVYFSNNASAKLLHGSLMSIAWCLLAVVGIFCIRYFSHTSWAIYVHILCLMGTALITIIMSTQLYDSDKFPYNYLSYDLILHSRTGMILSSLVIGQVTFGSLLAYYKIFTKNLQGVMILERMHKLTGWALLVVSLYNCVKGWIIYGKGSSGMIFTIGGIIIAAVLFIAFQLYQSFGRNRKNRLSLGLPEMTHKEAMVRIANGEMLMFADELVMNVSHLALGHPGGGFYIAESVGEDSGKYMVGCSSFDGQHNPYSHSAKAFSYVNHIAVAKIPYPQGYLTSDLQQPQDLIEVAIREKRLLNDSTYLIYLKSADYKMTGKCSSPEWLGKHFQFIINNRRTTVKRYYSSLFVDLPAWANELGLQETGEVLYDDGLFRFIFKLYPGGTMTNFINNLKVGEVITIKGPLGPGLLLSELKGNFLALAGGTGLVPFLDLVYMASKHSFSEPHAFHVSLFVFFRTTKDAFAIEILRKIETLDCGKWLNLVFVTDETVNKSQVPEMIMGTMKKQITNAWICGPSGFNRHYSEFLISHGLEKQKIIIM